MKANRPARAPRRRFGADERGASEAVGYTITFGISTIILLTSLSAFNHINQYAGEVALDRTVREVAAQTAFAVEEALRAGSSYPEMDFAMTITLPAGAQGTGYTVLVHDDHVWVIADNAAPATQDANGELLEPRGRARADFIQLPAAPVLCVDPTTVVGDGICQVRSDAGEFKVVYRDPDGTAGTSPAGVFLTLL